MAPRKQLTNNESKLKAAVKQGMPKRQAARRFCVPRSTLYDRINERYCEGRGRGRNPFLKRGEEEAIVQLVFRSKTILSIHFVQKI